MRSCKTTYRSRSYAFYVTKPNIMGTIVDVDKTDRKVEVKEGVVTIAIGAPQTTQMLFVV